MPERPMKAAEGSGHELIGGSRSRYFQNNTSTRFWALRSAICQHCGSLLDVARQVKQSD